MGIVKYFVFVFIFGVLVLPKAHGQYIPNSSQLFQFASGANPAFTGAESYGDLKFGYRYQWAGFGEGAPKFVNIAYSGRLKQPVDLVTHAPRMSNATELNSNAFIPARKRTIHGLGGNFFHESYGLVVRMGGAVNYGFHYPISNTFRLSLGVAAAIENIKPDYTKIQLGQEAQPDPFVEHLISSGSSHTDVSLRGGLLLYSRNFYFGFSYLPIMTQVIQNSDVAFSDAFYRGTVQLGAAFDLGPGVVLKPSVWGLLQMDNKVTIDYGVKAYIQDKLWLGVTYRDVKSSVALIGFNVNQLFGAAYSYEMSMGGMKKFNDGSHELVLSFKFNNFKRQGSAIW